MFTLVWLFKWFIFFYFFSLPSHFFPLLRLTLSLLHYSLRFFSLPPPCQSTLPSCWQPYLACLASTHPFRRPISSTQAIDTFLPFICFLSSSTPHRPNSPAQAPTHILPSFTTNLSPKSQPNSSCRPILLSLLSIDGFCFYFDKWVLLMVVGFRWWVGFVVVDWFVAVDSG